MINSCRVTLEVDGKDRLYRATIHRNPIVGTWTIEGDVGLYRKIGVYLMLGNAVEDALFDLDAKAHSGGKAIEEGRQ